MTAHKRERKRTVAPGMTAGIDADVSTQIAELQAAVESLSQQIAAIKIPESEEAEGYDDRNIKLGLKKSKMSVELLANRVRKLELAFPVHRYAYIQGDPELFDNVLLCRWYHPDRGEDAIGQYVSYVGYAPGKTASDYSIGQVITVTKMIYGYTDPVGNYVHWVDNTGGGAGEGGGGGEVELYEFATYADMISAMGLSDPCMCYVSEIDQVYWGQGQCAIGAFRCASDPQGSYGAAVGDIWIKGTEGPGGSESTSGGPVAYVLVMDPDVYGSSNHLAWEPINRIAEVIET